jgi:hypothetical protein
VRAVGAVAALVVAGSLIVAKEARHGHAASGKTVVAAVRMLPEGGGVRGVAFFRQQDLRLSGWVAVRGLAPRTAHAVHFHAPGRCGGPPADAVAAHRDLVSDRNGVAFLRLSVRVQRRVLERRVYYNVHRGPVTAGKTPSIACGDVQQEDNGG